MDTIRASPYGKIFRPDNFVSGNSGAGKYTISGEIRQAFGAKSSHLPPSSYLHSCNFFQGHVNFSLGLTLIRQSPMKMRSL